MVQGRNFVMHFGRICHASWAHLTWEHKGSGRHLVMDQQSSYGESPDRDPDRRRRCGKPRQVKDLEHEDDVDPAVAGDGH